MPSVNLSCNALPTGGEELQKLLASMLKDIQATATTVNTMIGDLATVDNNAKTATPVVVQTQP